MLVLKKESGFKLDWLFSSKKSEQLNIVVVMSAIINALFKPFIL